MANPVPCSDFPDAPSVCVVDDDDDYRELMVTALQEHCGVQRIETFSGGAPALAALRTAPAGDRPGLVLLDLHMPRVDGIAVLQGLREIGFAGRVVVVSNAGSPREREACQALGARFRRKPPRFEELVTLLQDLTTTRRSSDGPTHRPGGRS